jgi:cytochrome c
MGAKTFKQCQTCHTITDDAGNRISGNGAKIGPNLYGVVGRQAGSLEGFKYGASIKAAGEKGLIWDEEQLASYAGDPSKFLKAYLDDPKAKGNMSFKLRKAEDAENVATYLKSVGPEMPDGDNPATEAPASN